MPDQALVVIGAGHAGSELALSARQQGWQGSITLVGDEPSLPYHRPPLSKAFLSGAAQEESLSIRPAAAYANARIALRPAARLKRIARDERLLEFEDGTFQPYTKLALCLGGRARELVCTGLDEGTRPTNLLYLRNLADARKLRAQLGAGKRLVVIGGGYVGLEVAASALAMGCAVTLVEQQPRVLSRVAGAELSAFFENVHRSAGVQVCTGASIARVFTERDRIVGVELANGRRLDADVVVAGVGMLPNVEVAVVAGLGDERGIRVDECSRTIDEDIVAAGDCTVHRNSMYGRDLRLESVQNALEQARSAAAHVVGKVRPNHAAPWFWSDQYDLKLQTVGLHLGYDTCLLRGDPETRSFSALYLKEGRLLAVDCVNRPADFVGARRALVAPVQVDMERVVDPSCPLHDTLVA